jgi:SAM-dependent methyltransferase
LKFRFPAQSEATYQKLYDNAVVTNWSEGTVRTDWDVITNYLSKHLSEGASVLDFGCYTGGLLSRLDRGYKKYGVEINARAANMAAAGANAVVWTSRTDIPKNQRFDAIIASDVIEHIAKPLQFLEEVSSFLKEDGVLIFTTGDADNPNWNRFGANWWYCYYPEHISFISRAWLDMSLKPIGLRIQHCETFRYARLPVTRLLSDWLLTYLYGLFPRAYLGLKNHLEAMINTGKIRGAPGNGVSRDHLFVVLRPKVTCGQ